MKSREEFSMCFDVMYNNIASDRAPGLNEYEKSVFLTKAQNEIVKNIFTPTSKGNSLGLGFDGSQVRQADFANIVRATSVEPMNLGGVDDRNALTYKMPADAFAIITEEMVLRYQTVEKASFGYLSDGTKWDKGSVLPPGFVFPDGRTADAPTQLPDPSAHKGETWYVRNDMATNTHYANRQIVPLNYAEYGRLKSKPFGQPNKRQAWRIARYDEKNKFVAASIYLTSADLGKYPYRTYLVRYAKRPYPIILADLTEYGEDVKIEGEDGTEERDPVCELSENLHEMVVQRAVELAKVAWEGDANQTQLLMASGQRGE